MSEDPPTAGADPPGDPDLAPAVLDALARGRARFNRADFWGSHEALEEAWREAPSEARPALQGLIQAGAAFHKLIVQDNTHGAARLLDRALSRLTPYPPRYLGVDLAGFRAELRGWRRRVDDMAFVGSVVGLPRIEWAASTLRSCLEVEEVRLHAVQQGSARAVLVAVTAGGRTGWGECPHPWGVHGLWASLLAGAAPAMLAEPHRSPGEAAITMSGAVRDRAVLAGLEAALWDLWARHASLPLHEAIGFGGAAAGVPLAASLPAGGTTMLSARLAAVRDRPYAMVVLPARPNADRRVVPALARGVERPVAIDLGCAYRPSDIEALRVLDALAPVALARPVAPGALEPARTLRRWLSSPIALGGWEGVEEAESALALGAMDVAIVDPGACGVVAAREIGAAAAAEGAGLWIASSAVTDVGAARDLAVAMQYSPGPQVVLVVAVAGDGSACLSPDPDGRARPRSGPGIGFEPDPAWLAEVTSRQAVLRA